MDKLEEWKTEDGNHLLVNSKLWNHIDTIIFGNLISATEILFSNGTNVFFSSSENDRIKAKLVELGLIDAEIEELKSRDVLK